MRPPEGRIHLGEHVRLPDGRTGRVTAERLIQSNGAWKYVVAVEGGPNVEALDFELKRVAVST
jgi:hypothetical protein